MSNAITRLDVYKEPSGAWVFDDETKGLVKEPFVAGIDAMFDAMDSGSGKISILFSATPIPNYDLELSWESAEYGGNWYYCNGLNMDGWLCPALYKYFDEAPANIYIKITE